MVHPLKNILNKLRWDPSNKSENYLITYVHRGAPGDVNQINASEIQKLANSYFTMAGNTDQEETIIPFHRIVEIRSLNDDTILWKSRKVTHKLG